MQLVAKKEFRYDGIVRKPGDCFNASARAAKIFKGVGKAIDAPPDAADLPPLEMQSPPTPRGRRSGRYGRRDLRAQD